MQANQFITESVSQSCCAARIWRLSAAGSKVKGHPVPAGKGHRGFHRLRPGNVPAALHRGGGGWKGGGAEGGTRQRPGGGTRQRPVEGGGVLTMI